MNEPKRIAFVASECQPFFTSGGLGDVIGSLPKKIVKRDKGMWEVTVYLPLYSNINKAYSNKLVYVGQTIVDLSWRRQHCGIYKYVENNVTYYFLDNDYYFKRDRFYGYYDDAERFAFFSKAVITAMLYLADVPDIIHCHDWQTALVSIYLRTLYYHDEHFINTKRIFTIHNIEYQGKFSFDSDIIEDVFGIDSHDGYILEYNGQINLMKGAIECSNKVTTVSPTYAEEIKTEQYAHELENEIIRASEEGKLEGILNGIDTTFYNPKTDKALFYQYDQNNVAAKKQNKVELQKMVGLPVDENIPLIGMVTRLVWHKGLDFIKKSFDKIIELGVQFLVLGTGDSFYEGFLKDMEAKYPHQVKIVLTFNQDLARKIYASTDLFLMPSASEPCGLSQMIACRYGAIPMVRSTGGLHDSIIDFSNGNGNGYSFDGWDATAMYEMIVRAVKDYQKEDWSSKIEQAMDYDFSWNASAKSYIKMYKNILK